MEGRERDILLIDIANPRDIEDAVSEVPYVNLHNIDSLRVINEKSIQMRREEAKKVEVLIDEELSLLNSQYKRQRADGLISQMYAMIYGVRKHEVERAVNRLSAYHTIGDIECEVIDDLTHALVNKILAEPTKILRNAAEKGDDDLLDAASKLFNVKLNKEK